MATTIGPEKRAAIAKAWPDILQRVGAGDRVDHSCAAHGFKRQDLLLFRQGNAELTAAWYDAMKDSADAFLDKLTDVMVESETNAKGARVKASILQWLAEKRDPDKYGQRTRADINVKTVDLTAIIKDANARLAAAKEPRLIQGDRIITADSPGALVHAQSAITHATLEAAGLL
jgi:hypothetical protein